MSTQLHPITRQRLEQYGRRRQTMLWLRGIAAFVLALLFGVLAVVVVDAFWVVDDAVRWTLSAVAYTSAISTLWWLCLRTPVRKMPTESMALNIEAAEPNLHEQLLAAIELGQSDEDNLSRGSSTFRGLLQEQVARHITGIELRKLLPASLVRRWILYALFAVSLCVGLLFVPGLNLGHRLMRAFFPGINLGRISTVTVDVIRPSPAAGLVPQNETIAVEIAVKKLGARKVYIETKSADAGTESRLMQLSASDQYIINLLVGEQPIDYRILAGDAVTQWYRLEPRARPHVEVFEKKYHYPAYTRLTDQQLDEPHGDLIGILGSEVAMILKTDQWVSEARLEMVNPGAAEPKPVALERISDNEWRISMKLINPAEYHVYLVSAETGFDNPISPRYLIRPQEDLPPRVQFTDVTDWSQLVSATEYLPLAATADDELPLTRVEQLYSVNDNQWKIAPREFELSPKMEMSWNWDLLALQVKVGDNIRTKLRATDLKGQSSESQTLELLVTASDFDPDRHRLASLRCSLSPLLIAFAAKAGDHWETANPMIESLKQGALEQTPERSEKRSKLVRMSRELSSEAQRIRGLVVPIAKQMTETEDAQELDLVARVLGRIEMDWMATANTLLSDEWLALTDDQRRQDLDRIRVQFAEANNGARRTEQLYRELVSHDVVTAVATDMRAVNDHLKLAESGHVRQEWSRFSRHLTISLRQLRSVEKFFLQHRDAVRPNTSTRANQYQTWLEQFAAPLEELVVTKRESSTAAKETAEPKNPEEVKKAETQKLAKLNQLFDRMRNELRSQGTLNSVDSDLRWHLREHRKGLEMTGGWLTPILRENEQAMRANVDQQASAGGDKTADSQTFQQASQRVWNEFVRVQQPRLNMLAVRRDGISAVKGSEPLWAGDIGLAERALQVVLQHLESPDTTRRSVNADLQTISSAVATLESGHEAMDTIWQLEVLSRAEEFKHQSLEAAFAHPHAWDSITSRFEVAAERLKDAGFPNEVADAFNRLRWNPMTEQVRLKFEPRYDKLGNFASAFDELSSLVAYAKEFKTKAKPVMDEARRKLSELAPSLPELAKKAAEKFEQLSEDTKEQAEDVAKAEQTQQTPESLREQLAEAQDLLEKLAEALVDEADAQDLTTPLGREIAQEADQALESLKEQTQEINQELAQAEKSEAAADQAENLEQAAVEEKQLADTLANVAEQMEQLVAKAAKNDPTALADSSAEAEPLANQQPAAKKNPEAKAMQEQYEQAERLSKLANMDKQDMLKRLEEELKKNEPMQQALSDIAEQTAQEVQATLRTAEKQEKDINQRLQESDTHFIQQKRELVAQVQDIAKQASFVNDKQLQPAQNESNSAGQPEIGREIDQVRQELAQSATQGQQTNEQQALAETHAAAQNLAKELREAAEQAKAEAKKLAEKAKEETKAKPNELENKRRDAENHQKNVQNQQVQAMEHLAREADAARKGAEQQFQQAEKLNKDAERNLENAKRLAEQNKDNEWHQAQLPLKEDEMRAANAVKEAAEQRKNLAEQRANQRQEQVQQIRAQALPELKSNNPMAELAQRHAEQAAEKAQQLAQAAEQLAQAQDWEKQLQPESQTAAAQANQQDTVQKDVAQAAEDLARASRHEQRLGNRDAASELGERAEGVDEAATHELPQSAEKLADAGKPANAGRPKTLVEPAKGQELAQSVDAAKQAIGEQAEKLENMLAASDAMKADAAMESEGEGESQTPSPKNASEGNPPQGKSSQQAASKPPSGQPSGQPKSGQPESQQASQPPSTVSKEAATADQQAKAQMMARLLDELDRQLANSQGSDATPPPGKQPAGEQPPTPGAIADATQALAQQMRQQRQQMSEQLQKSNQQANQLAQESNSKESQKANMNAQAGDYDVEKAERTDGEWGKLRTQSAEDLAESKRTDVPPEYRRLLDVYYRVLAEKTK